MVWTAHDSSGRPWWRRDALRGGATTAASVRWPGGYGEPFSMRSSPTGAAWDGELT
jgi:hypothetical protein